MDPEWHFWNLWFFGPAHKLRPKLKLIWMSSITIPRMVENIHQRLVMTATTGIRTAKICMETRAATTSVTSVAGSAGISWASFLVRKLSYVITTHSFLHLSTIISFLTIFVLLVVPFVRRMAVPPTVNSKLALNALEGPWLHRLNLRHGFVTASRDLLPLLAGDSRYGQV